MNEVIEIPFGAKDSELIEAGYHIPKGFHAEIIGNEVVIKKGESPDISKPTKEILDAATVYKIPKGYEVEVQGDSIYLWEERWKPRVGEAYYEWMVERYTPIKRICVGERFEGKTVFKTYEECLKVCKFRNKRIKLLIERLKQQGEL